MDYILLILAVQRAVLLLLKDRITQPLRTLAQRGPAWLQYLMACPYCLSVWAAGALVALQWYGGPAGRFLVAVLAVSGGYLNLEGIPALLLRGGSGGDVQRDRGPCCGKRGPQRQTEHG